MTGSWTFEDLDRLTREAIEAGDQELLGSIWYSDSFEPSLGAPGGLIELICDTPAKKAEERKRVAAIKAERAAIKARWAAQPS